jgi:hypothetical protein
LNNTEKDMVLLIRFILVSLIIYLIIRSFKRLGENSINETPHTETEKKSKKTVKGVPKELGDYVDYEEVD